MKILILGLNYAPERVGIAVYTTGMAEVLSAKGYEVQIVAGQPYYPAWAVMEGYKKYGFSRHEENGVAITRVPHYVPANPTGAKRLLHHASFALMALLPMLAKALRWRPDVVMTIAPSLIASPVARLAARLSGAKSWLHIQDFEVEAAFATKLLKDDGFGGRLARGFERNTLSAFSVVSTISPQMCRKLAEKGVAAHDLVEFRNWADIDAITPMPTGQSAYRQEWNIQTPQVALYSGNIANKQGIDIVVAAARALQHRRDLTFIVCGEGPNRANLQTLAAGLNNIQLHDLQPKERLNDLLGLATIHLLPQLAEAADLVLPSKLTNMLASGKPVVATALPDTGLYLEVEGCGLLCPPENAEAFANSIQRLIDEPDLAADFATEARTRARDRWSGTSILSTLEERLRALVTGSGEITSQSAGATE